MNFLVANKFINSLELLGVVQCTYLNTFQKNSYFYKKVKIKSQNCHCILRGRDPDFVSKSPEPFTRQQKLK